MNYFSVSEIARRWVVSERTVRNWCAVGKIKGAFLTGKTWNIPEDAVRPRRGKEKPHSDNPLLNILKEQKDMQLRGGIYHRVQIELTYIFETNTLGVTDQAVNVDDVIETSNHFRCIDLVIDKAASGRLTETFVKELHRILKAGTSDSRRTWFRVGEYKKLPNEVGGQETTPPEQVAAQMKALLSHYNALTNKLLKTSWRSTTLLSAFIPSRTATAAWVGLSCSRSALPTASCPSSSTRISSCFTTGGCTSGIEPTNTCWIPAARLRITFGR